MCDIDKSTSWISQTELELVSSHCDSDVSQVSSCEEVPASARGWDKAQTYLATIDKNQRRSFERAPRKKFRKSSAPEADLCVETTAGEQQRVYEDSDDNEAEEINFNLDQESQNDQNITNCDIGNDIEQSVCSDLEFNASDVQWDLDETLDEGSFGFGVAHGSLRGDSLDARVLNPDVIQNELDKYYTNISFHDDQKVIKKANLPPTLQDLKKKKANNLKEFEEKYPIHPGAVPKPSANRANVSHLPTTENPKRRLDNRRSMTEKLNTISTDMCSPHDRHNIPKIRVTRPWVDLPVEAMTPVQNHKYLVVPKTNIKPGSRLRINPDEVISNEDQNIPIDSCSTLDESFRNDATPVCDLTYTIADSPEEQSCPTTANPNPEKMWPYGKYTDIPTLIFPTRRRSAEHSKGSPVRIVPPRDASPRGSPAQIRGTQKYPEETPARLRVKEIRQQVQNFFDNGKGPQVCPRVRFEKPSSKVAEPVCPRARGIVPEDVIQTGVYYCGINNVCQTNDPPCVPKSGRGSPPRKPSPGKLPSSKYSPNKRDIPADVIQTGVIYGGITNAYQSERGSPPRKPLPGKFPLKPRKKPRRDQPELPKVPRPWIEAKPKKKKNFNLTEEQKALVLDNYYPGLIHDAVNQNADFNEVARKFVTPDSAVDGDKAEKGMSLLEAFDTRLKFEQICTKNFLTTPTNKRIAPPSYQHTYDASSKPVTHDIICEDNVRPTAIVDLQQFVRSLPENDPVRAIACLTRAQHLNEYYKEYRAAQLAAQSVPPEQVEQAALFGVRQFQIDSLSSETKTVHSEFYKCLELVSYVGVTKPN